MEIGGFGQEAARASSPVLDLVLQADDFLAEWKRCDLVANYVGDYAAYQFVQHEWAENLVSTVTNELLEATVRLSPPSTLLTLQCVQYADHLLLEAGHSLRRETIEPYTVFLKELCTRDYDSNELYFRLLTSAEKEALAFNQLGLAMLVHDFGARLAARVDEAEGRIQMRVFIPTRELSV